MSCVWVSAVLKQLYILGMVMKMCTCTSERTCRTWLILFRLDLAAAPGGQAGDVRGVLQRSAAAYSASRRTVDVRRLVSRVSAHARVCRLVSGEKLFRKMCRQFALLTKCMHTPYLYIWRHATVVSSLSRSMHNFYTSI